MKTIEMHIDEAVRRIVPPGRTFIGNGPPGSPGSMIYNIKEAVREAIKAGIEIGRKDYAARARIVYDAPEETKVVEVKAEAVKNETCSSSGDDDRRLNAFSWGRTSARSDA